jgi:hypothetical protein
MITAEEAREKTKQNIKSKQDKEMVLVHELCQKLDEQINLAIKEEKFTTQMMVGNLSEYQTIRLASIYQQLGYDCRVTFQRSDYWCYINWNDTQGMDIGQ